MNNILKFSLFFSQIFLFNFNISAHDLKLDKKNYQDAVNSFYKITKKNSNKIKPGSKEFFYDQGKKTHTVLLLHGLSDSPGSMREIANVYYSLGFNVLSLLLRDHGLLEEFRNVEREEITLEKWRKDIDTYINLALKFSDSDKISLVGYSLGGALTVDAAIRHTLKISSFALVAPMLKIKGELFAKSFKYIRSVKHSFNKGIEEMPHFYPDIAFNQVAHSIKLTKSIDKYLKEFPPIKFLLIPKIIFLTSADTTVSNKYTLKIASKMNVRKSNIVYFENDKESETVLHRDLPMKNLNLNNKKNPHLDDLLNTLYSFVLDEELLANRHISKEMQKTPKEQE